MSENINWALNVQVVGGPKIVESGTIPAEAYDKIQVNIPIGGVETAVDVQPSGPGQAQFLMIQCDQYGANITYKVNVPAADSIILDGPLVLIGKSAVGLLDPNPTKLLFYNNLPEEISIQIFAGRDATP